MKTKHDPEDNISDQDDFVQNLSSGNESEDELERKMELSYKQR